MKILVIVLLVLGMLNISWRDGNDRIYSVSMGLITNLIVLLLLIFKVISIS
jgi:hypothetical protein